MLVSLSILTYLKSQFLEISAYYQPLGILPGIRLPVIRRSRPILPVIVLFGPVVIFWTVQATLAFFSSNCGAIVGMKSMNVLLELLECRLTLAHVQSAMDWCELWNFNVSAAFEGLSERDLGRTELSCL